MGILNFPPLETAVVDSFKLFCLQERRDLTAAVEFYCGRSHEGAAHSALADAKASLEVLQGQVRQCPKLCDVSSGCCYFLGGCRLQALSEVCAQMPGRGSVQRLQEVNLRCLNDTSRSATYACIMPIYLA